MTRAHVGLGSNLGDRLAILDTAVRVLDADEQTHVMAVSRVYETAPVGGPDQGPYLNAVAVLETDRSPRELLDLLLYDGPPVDSPELTVPHPRARERAFVLVPLCDADPFARFPDGELAAAALARLGPVTGVVPVGELEA
jgi:7,8-dihydro-6-hydroxymethylpterin-pyrophosphokinase